MMMVEAFIIHVCFIFGTTPGHVCGQVQSPSCATTPVMTAKSADNARSMVRLSPSVGVTYLCPAWF
jgi:hypothetical protein